MTEPQTDRQSTVEEICDGLRRQIKSFEHTIVALLDHPEFKGEEATLEGPNIPYKRLANMKANLTLVFRHLEDARMRIGKVMQAYQGGISILDKK